MCMHLGLVGTPPQLFTKCFHNGLKFCLRPRGRSILTTLYIYEYPVDAMSKVCAVSICPLPLAWTQYYRDVNIFYAVQTAKQILIPCL